jgi:peptide/nickel transport system permease protein
MKRTSALSRLLRIRLAMAGFAVILVVGIAALFGPVFAPYSPTAFSGNPGSAPLAAGHVLGTDSLGRDQLTRLLYGARVSFEVSIMAVAIGTLAGGLIGLIAATFGGFADGVLMRIVDAMLALPGLVLPLTLIAAVGGGVVTVAVALGVAFIPAIARVTRAQALGQIGRDYVLAATTCGAGRWRIMLRHVTPNSLAPIIVQASLAMSVAVIGEAGLSFLGVGVHPPTATWGTMLSMGFDNIRSQPWAVVVPASAIFVLVLSFNFVGDGLRDVLDPRLRGAL